jgi:hypothetical protein
MLADRIVQSTVAITPAQTGCRRHKPKKTRTEWAGIANSHQRQVAEGLINLGKTLIKAKADLPHGEWGKLLRDNLKMRERFAQGVMKLARNPRFAKPSNLTLLPPTLTALAAIAEMPDNIYNHGIASGAINPRTTAKQAQFLTVQVVRTTRKIAAPCYVPAEPPAIPHHVFAPRREPEPEAEPGIVDLPQPPDAGYRALDSAWERASDDERRRFMEDDKRRQFLEAIGAGGPRPFLAIGST